MAILPLHAVSRCDRETTHVVIVDGRFDATVGDNLEMILAEEEVDSGLEVKSDFFLDSEFESQRENFFSDTSLDSFKIAEKLFGDAFLM